MELATLLVRLVEALAWPAAVLIIFLILRKQLLTMLPLLKRLKAGPVEAEFEREVEQIKHELIGNAADPNASPKAASRRQQLIEIAQINPRTAIIDAWQGIEFALKKAAFQRFGGDSPPPDISSPISLVRRLAQEQSLSHDDVSLFHELRGLRNQAIHAPDFSPTFESAQDYIELSIRLQAKLDVLAAINN